MIPEEAFMGAIAFAPGDSNIVYAGTGDADFDIGGAIGVLKSADGGTTWQLLATTTFSQNVGISDIKVDPQNSESAIAAAATGNPNLLQLGGVFKSIDGGQNWSRKLTGS